MGEDCGSRHHQHCWPNQSPNLNCTGFVPVQGMQNAFPAYTSLYKSYVASEDVSPAGFTSTKSPQVKMGQTYEQQERWFYCLPRHRQALTPIPKTTAPSKGYFSPDSHGCNKNVTPEVVTRPVEKRFLVFDQSGNQTNLIFSSFIGSPPIQCTRLGTSGSFQNVLVEEPRTIKDAFFQGGPIISDEILENQECDEKSEMHEDTEELNALLYSSSDEEDDYDEETSSTGHSPSKIDAQPEQEQVNESAEEVASSGTPPTKRKRQFYEEYSYAFSVVDTASSGKPNGSSECEDDAESSCGESRTHGREIELSHANKRAKTERIRETINILQDIIPGGKGKDAMLVLDEAIQYLMSLKLKAKCLGEILY